MLHSHPQWDGNSTDNDRFSYGDSLVAVLSGKIYLTTPHGEVYALDREDGRKLINSVKKRNRINRIDKRMDKRGVPDLERPDWVVDGVAPGGYVDQHNAWARGSNFITFDTETYDTRK